MIRFLDAEVFAVQRSEAVYELVKYAYLQKEYIDNIFVVYNEDGSYHGVITFDSFRQAVESEDTEGYIFSKKWVLASDDDNMWSELKNMIRTSGIRNAVIPVFNARDEILYFAYDDQVPVHEKAECILEDLESMEDGILCRFFAEAYPQVRRVRIHDLNEWGYRLFKIMLKAGYYVETQGEKWENFYPQIGVKKVKETGGIPKKSFMDIYAEGTKSGWGQNPSVRRMTAEALALYWVRTLYALSADFYNWTEKEFICNCEGLRLLKVTVPKKGQMRCKFPGEESCSRSIGDAFEVGTPEDIAYCQKVYGRNIAKEEWDRLCKNKKLESKNIAGNAVRMLGFGEEKSPKLYVVGPCIVVGNTVCNDTETFLYCLYHELHKRGMEYSVVGLVAAQSFQMKLYRDILDSLTIWENDMVICIWENGGDYTYAEGRKLDLTETYDSRGEYWFYDMPIHTNYAGNQAIAERVAKEVLDYAKEAGKIQRGGIRIGRKLLSLAECDSVERYIRQIQFDGQRKETERGGAIVMNCNPMTKGHLHLLETARKFVDYLYVFVVEEDKSDIPFAVRYAMVWAQAKEMADVHVVPSGKFILSYETLPLYFEKAEKQEAALDATEDLQIFCQYIAPRLGIRERFVGEEPTDKITRQYNEEMKRILPYYGMKLTEIPRVKQQGKYISASMVRKLTREGNWEVVRQLMPEEAYRIYMRDYISLSGDGFYPEKQQL